MLKGNFIKCNRVLILLFVYFQIVYSVVGQDKIYERLLSDFNMNYSFNRHFYYSDSLFIDTALSCTYIPENYSLKFVPDKISESKELKILVLNGYKHDYYPRFSDSFNNLESLEVLYCNPLADSILSDGIIFNRLTWLRISHYQNLTDLGNHIKNQPGIQIIEIDYYFPLRKTFLDFIDTISKIETLKYVIIALDYSIYPDTLSELEFLKDPLNFRFGFVNKVQKNDFKLIRKKLRKKRIKLVLHKFTRKEIIEEIEIERNSE